MCEVVEASFCIVSFFRHIFGWMHCPHHSPHIPAAGLCAASAEHGSCSSTGLPCTIPARWQSRFLLTLSFDNAGILRSSTAHPTVCLAQPRHPRSSKWRSEKSLWLDCLEDQRRPPRECEEQSELQPKHRNGGATCSGLTPSFPSSFKLWGSTRSSGTTSPSIQPGEQSRASLFQSSSQPASISNPFTVHCSSPSSIQKAGNKCAVWPVFRRKQIGSLPSSGPATFLTAAAALL